MTKITVNAYCTIKKASDPDFEHELNLVRDRSDAELMEHLEGFSGYIATHGGEMSARLYALHRHIQRVQVHYSFEIEEEQLILMAGWGLNSNAIFFLPDGTIRSPQGKVLLSQDAAEVDAEGSVPYPHDALQRKDTTEGFLSYRELEASPALPPVIGEGEVTFRSASEVARRALALFTVSLRAASMAAGQGVSVDILEERFPTSFQYLSPAEKAFMSEPDEHSCIQLAWRYEALNLLFWALGTIKELPFPDEICEVKSIIRIMAELDPDKFIEEAELIDTSRLLDALDMHFRAHWIVRQAQKNDEADPAGLNSSVIIERHYALNWLVQFENADWDDVDIPT